MGITIIFWAPIQAQIMPFITGHCFDDFIETQDSNQGSPRVIVVIIVIIIVHNIEFTFC
jgi:hypothetical protein